MATLGGAAWVAGVVTAVRARLREDMGTAGQRTRVRWQEHAGVHWAYAGKEPVALGCVLEPDSERIIEPIWRPPLCGYASVCAGPWVQRI